MHDPRNADDDFAFRSKVLLFICHNHQGMNMIHPVLKRGDRLFVNEARAA